MTHLDISALLSWSVVTAILMAIAGVVYRKLSQKAKDEPHTP